MLFRDDGSKVGERLSLLFYRAREPIEVAKAFDLFLLIERATQHTG